MTKGKKQIVVTSKDHRIWLINQTSLSSSWVGLLKFMSRFMHRSNHALGFGYFMEIKNKKKAEENEREIER